MVTLTSLVTTAAGHGHRRRPRGVRWVAAGPPTGRSGRCSTPSRPSRRSSTWSRSWFCSARAGSPPSWPRVIYAVPVATKLVADGIRGVSPTTVEAAESAGTSRWQMITKVQLPMARGALLLAANQGLLYVLSMVVIGGMVGGGALGFDVVTGFGRTMFGGASRQESRSRCSASCSTGSPRTRGAVQLSRQTPPASSADGRRDNRPEEPCTKPHTYPADHPRCARRARAGGLRGRRHREQPTRGASERLRRPATWPSTRGWATSPMPTSIGRVAETELGCTLNYVDLDEQISWKGFGAGDVDGSCRELGPPGAGQEVHRGRGHRPGRRLHRQRRHHRLVRAAVAGREVPRHRRLGEPQQVLRHVRDPGVRRQGQLLDGDPATSPTTRRW